MYNNTNLGWSLADVVLVKMFLDQILCLRMSPWWNVPCIYRMPGGVNVGDLGLCCCGPAFNV